MLKLLPAEPYAAGWNKPEAAAGSSLAGRECASGQCSCRTRPSFGSPCSWTLLNPQRLRQRIFTIHTPCPDIRITCCHRPTALPLSLLDYDYFNLANPHSPRPFLPQFPSAQCTPAELPRGPRLLFSEQASEPPPERTAPCSGPLPSSASSSRCEPCRPSRRHLQHTTIRPLASTPNRPANPFPGKNNSRPRRRHRLCWRRKTPSSQKPVQPPVRRRRRRMCRL